MNTTITMKARRYVAASVVAATLALASLGTSAVSANQSADDASGSLYPANSIYIATQLPASTPYIASDPATVAPVPFVGGLQTDNNADRD